MESKIEEKLLRKTVMRFAITRFQRLAIEVIDHVRQYPACVVMSDNKYSENLWDDYCYEQQNGPADFWESAWSDLFAPHLTAVVAALDRTEATLLTFDCCWDQGEDPVEIIGDPPNGVYEDALTAEIMKLIIQTALDREWPDSFSD